MLKVNRYQLMDICVPTATTSVATVKRKVCTWGVWRATRGLASQESAQENQQTPKSLTWYYPQATPQCPNPWMLRSDCNWLIAYDKECFCWQLEAVIINRTDVKEWSCCHIEHYFERLAGMGNRKRNRLKHLVRSLNIKHTKHLYTKKSLANLGKLRKNGYDSQIELVKQQGFDQALQQALWVRGSNLRDSRLKLER